MKKYLSLLIVFLMVFVLGNQMAQAKDGEDDSSDDIKIETSANVEIETSDEDNDDDNDGVLDIKDLKELDHDNDGLPDDEDNDDDEDGILDVGDLKLFDHDNDGLDDSKDKDDDNDKILDINDSKPFDRDNDGQHDDANKETQTKREEIKKQIPGFYFHEAEIGQDPDKRNYIVSNQKIEATGFKPQHSLQDGIAELIKGYQIVRNNKYTNT